MKALPQPGQIYYHYKYFTCNNPVHEYTIISIAGNAHNNDYEDKWVVYKNTNDVVFMNSFGIDSYIRPLEEFLEDVQINGTTMPRFQPK